MAAIVEESFSDIVSVELRENSFTVESLSREFPRVRFLLLDDSVSIGARINMAMRIMNAEAILVMWSTMDPPGSITRALETLKRTGTVCLSPALRNERGEALPVVQVPALQRRQLRVMTLPIRGRAVDTLFPFDYVGLYDRRRFEGLGMFDEQIGHPFWQKLDFGFRAALWGEQIRVEPTFRMTYRSMPEPEDQTASEGYERFYARNLAVRIRESGAGVPLLQALPFAIRSRKSIAEALRVFRDASGWVERNRERFLHDARTVVKEWSIDNA
ncbi:MAG: hypothetical protein EA427_05930 [Spirochaetaceae bacterium]|nr:MAG: hypothetical protein EA427_05930 [Spirochaetaceae bacterium]